MTIFVGVWLFCHLVWNGTINILFVNITLQKGWQDIIAYGVGNVATWGWGGWMAVRFMESSNFLTACIDVGVPVRYEPWRILESFVPTSYNNPWSLG